MKRRRINWWLWLGLSILLLLGLMALAPGLFAANDPNKNFYNEMQLLRPIPSGPGGFALSLGTDHLGRDLWSRLVYGARMSLGLGVVIALVRMLIGVPLGLWAGWQQGYASSLLRTLASTGAAIPVLVMLILILRPIQQMGLGEGGYRLWILLFIGFVAASGVPRVVEAVRRRVKAMAGAPFLEGAVAVGAGRVRILRRHVLPHLLPELSVLAAAEIAWVILLLGQLGIAGIILGGGQMDYFAGTVRDSIPEWGQALAAGRNFTARVPMAFWAPATFFAIATMGFHMTAEGLRRHWQRLP